MKRSLSKFLQITIPLGLGVFLIGYIYYTFTPEQISETKKHFSSANYFFVVLAVLLNILSHLSRAYRWNFMLAPLGYRPKLANNFMALSVGYLLNVFIPRSGEVSRAALLHKYERIPFQKGFGTIISERAVDLIFLAIFTSVALIIEYDVLYDYAAQNIPAKTLLTLGLVGIVFVVGLALYLRFSRSGVNNKIKTFLTGLKDGIFSVVKMRKKGAFLFHTILIWMLYFLAFYAALFALPETASVPFGTAIIAFVVGGFVFSFTNSGFGSYPFAIAAILSVFGILKTVGIAFGWIVWISNFSTTVIIGILSLVLLPFYNRKRS